MSTYSTLLMLCSENRMVSSNPDRFFVNTNNPSLPPVVVLKDDGDVRRRPIVVRYKLVVWYLCGYFIINTNYIFWSFDLSTKIITANFTLDGVALTGLTPTVAIYLLDAITPTTNTLIVSNGATTEIGLGWYRYEFTSYDVTKNYVFSFDGGVSVPPVARFQHGANDVNAADGWEEPALDHLNVGTLGYAVTQTKADTSTILTTALPAVQSNIDSIAAEVRAELSVELAKILSLQNGLTVPQATMLVEIYTMYGLDPTKPLVVDLTVPSNGSRTFGDISQTVVVAGNTTTVTRD